ncbi:hypothetical protein C0075_18145 [Rhizobium sp. KAs_5_22]|uniref:hypothetical protein n=1 Tax=Ciceribacter selenitireducens TaxID=448181 RepID=UPI00048BA1D8|nr:hypothetical protein [Ciceribacter selenitireducens]PPJ48715.1 hypothetical protein C0075_18145 [Rhizobium sp. KAs_5_22]
MSVMVSRGVLAASLLMVLSGCNAGNPGGVLGSAADKPTAAPAASPAADAAAAVQGFCPPITLRDGTAYHRTYAKGAKDDATKIVYQASLADTTRSCTRSETGMTITAMVQGRLVAGPEGKAGQVMLPIRVAVTDGETVVYSELTQFPVTLADVAQASQFVFTKDVPVPGNVSGLTKVHVGFDEGPVKKK